MNTYEARGLVRDLGVEVLAIVGRLAEGREARFDDVRRLHATVQEVTESVADAGYPGERVWLALRRAAIGVDTQLGQSDPSFWKDLEEDLREAVETLDSLVSTRVTEKSDFRIIG